MSETWMRDRRGFLKALAAGGAALGLGGAPAQAQRRGKTSDNERIEVGSIGVGDRGDEK